MNDQRTKSGFSIADLITTLGAISVLFLVAVPAVGNNRTSSNATICLSNMRQLMNAWQVYTADNRGRFIENYYPPDANSGISRPKWCGGWLDWTIGPDNTNRLFIRDVRYSKLAPYITSEHNIHKCPEDTYLPRHKGGVDGDNVFEAWF
jgi:hypothetical protein